MMYLKEFLSTSFVLFTQGSLMFVVAFKHINTVPFCGAYSLIYWQDIVVKSKRDSNVKTLMNALELNSIFRFQVYSST